MYEKYVKRVCDVTGAGLILVIGAPLWLLIALLVRILIGHRVTFRQVRIGMHHEPFTLVKFRTMTEARDASGELLSDEQRLTRFGKLLRKTSLDEIPQLFNVLAGHMSLIGPRPLLPEYLPLYSKSQLQRHNVCPGITGLAQVNGRNAIDWETKFNLDVEYACHVTLRGDLKIIIGTLKTILKPGDVSAQDHATMPVFRGGITPNEDD